MFYRLIVFACTTLVLGAPRVDRNPSLRSPNVGIIGGRYADIKDYPYQVAVLFNGAYVCGGSILDETHILTAEYPTDLYSPQQLQIRAGSSFFKDGGTVVYVEEIYRHPLSSIFTAYYDVAVLVLEKPLNFSETIAPIELAEDELPEGTKVNVTGWGAVSTKGISPPPINQLHVISPSITSQKKCRSYFNGTSQVDQLICAGFDKDGKGICYGDFGGPLVYNNKQYGIISSTFRFDCAKGGFPDVYTNVVAVRDFIMSHLKQH